MPIGWNLFWVIIVALTIVTTGCNASPVAGSGIAASSSEGQGPTVEIRGRSPENKDYVSKSVAIHLGRGNVYVTVVGPTDANRVLFVARGVLLTDNPAEFNFIRDKTVFNPDGTVTVEFTPGGDVPALDVHVNVPESIPVQIEADSGNIQISGNTGAVTAQANGSIEVRGATQNLKLTAQGENHGITVDGAHHQLTLHAEKGPIEITADDVNINASTGSGDILFVGRLLPGTSYFTTTGNSNITVMMQRYDFYDIDANTTSNTIDVQYPAMAEGSSEGNPVCGTFNSGSPYIIQADDSAHETRGQVTINKGDARLAGPVRLIGRVTPDYFVFHSTVRNVFLELPRTNEFFPQTLFDNPVSAQPIATDQPVTPTLQTPPPVPQLTQADQDLINRFQGTPAAAVELSPGQIQSTPKPVSSGSLMYSDHCPIAPEKRLPGHVKIFATSNGGPVRIYQNLP